MNAALLEAVRYFTRETEIMDALHVVCGCGRRTEKAWDGRDAGESAVYDLASVTKLFTGLTAMRLREEGALDFSRTVTDYDPRFRNLRDVTVEQLMAFQVQVQTDGRIDAQPDREAALKSLLRAFPVPHPAKRAYSDIPAMILKYVMEKAAGESFYSCVRKCVLEPAGMAETWAKVPEERKKDCLLYAPEYRIENGRRIRRDSPDRGIPHDPKAEMLQGDTEDLCGHAGLFSTARDMERFCRAVLSGKVVSSGSLAEMAVNRTGKRLEDGTWTQFLGYQCYLHHPDQYFSEIPVYMSPSAFGIGGFTGNHVSIDPGTDRFSIFLGNRVRNRLTVILPKSGEACTACGLRADGVGRILWEDGSLHASSVNYVHQKDEHLHKVIASLFDE